MKRIVSLYLVIIMLCSCVSAAGITVLQPAAEYNPKTGLYETKAYVKNESGKTQSITLSAGNTITKNVASGSTAEFGMSSDEETAYVEIAGDVTATAPYVAYDEASQLYKVSSYVKNNTDTPQEVTLSGGADFVTKTLAAGENTEIGMFTEKAAEYKLICGDTEIVTAEYDPNITFDIAETSAKDGYSPQEEMYVTFTNPIDKETLKNVMLYEDGKKKEIVTSFENGKLRVAPKDGMFSYGVEMRLMLEGICDITGDEIKTSEIIFESVEISEEFPAYQTTETVSQAGIGGFSMLATLNGDSQIYFERETQVPEQEDTLPYVPSCYAKIFDPTGEMVDIIDLTDSPTGRVTYVRDIKYAEGIWHIQFISGRTGDELTIGISNAKSWGVRGETALGVTSETLRESYLYVPEKATSMVISSQKACSFELYNGDGELVGEDTSANKTFGKSECVIENLTAGEIYKLVLDNGFYGGLFVDRIPSLMCPTAEMAAELCGGWRDVEGIIVQGPLQEQARREALRLLETKNFNYVSPQRPTEIPEVENPVAESLVFGAYGLVSPVADQVKRQVIDPSSPYLGRSLTADEYNAIQAGEEDVLVSWETGNYNAWGDTSFGPVVAMNAELNYLYENEVLINRSALQLLGMMTALSEDFIIREGSDAANYPTTHGNFYYSWNARNYNYIRKYLDPQTVEILDKGFSALCDKQGNYRGQNVNNQWMFTVNGIEATYRATEEKRHLEALRRHVKAIGTPYLGKLGQSSAGFYIENSGADGSYHNLNTELIYTMYKEHKNSDVADEEILSLLKESIQKNLEFESLFWTTQPERVGIAGPNSFTSRTTSLMGCIDHINYPAIVDEFPLAKRRFEIQNTPITGLGGAGTFPYYVNSDEWAYRLFKNSWSKYDNGIKDYKAKGSPAWYEALKNRDNCVSEPLPCEYESGIWDKPGIIAVKHDGLYFNIFYTYPEIDFMPDNSYMGGGLTTLWSEPTGNVIASKKHLNYDTGITGADEIMATCVYGTDSNGKLIYNGKGQASLAWIDDSSFKITENIPGTNASVEWTYTLLDDCIEMKAQVYGDINGAVLNIPVEKLETKAVITSDSNAVYYTFGNSQIAIATENEATVSAKEAATRLRVAADENGIMTVKIFAQKADGLQIADETDTSVRVLNGTSEEKEVDVYYAVHDASGKLTEVSADTVKIPAHGFGDIPKKDGKRTLIWDEQRPLGYMSEAGGN